MFFWVWGKKLKEAQQFWFQNASAAHLAVAGVTCSIFFLLCTLAFLYGTNSLEVWTFPFTESLFWNLTTTGSWRASPGMQTASPPRTPTYSK